MCEFKYQKSIAIRVLEGETSRPEDCLLLGKVVLRDLPDFLRRGQPVDVTYEYDAGGRLRVHAKLPQTEHQIQVELLRDQALAGREIEAWKRALTRSGEQTFEQMLEDFLKESNIAE